jgi:hypothetical protein
MPECERCQAIDAWVKEGEALFSQAPRWSFWFWLGAWWERRPWSHA